MEPADNTFEVTVQVSDGKDDSGTAETPPVADASLNVVVTVTDANDAPIIGSGSNAFNVDENKVTTVVIQTYVASDVDAIDDTLSWTRKATMQAISPSRKHRWRG